jgi:hypothetical protein
MVMPLISGIGALIVASGIVFAQHLDSGPHDPNGGVLCGWASLFAAHADRERCYPGEKSEFGAALDDSILRVERFIKENDPEALETLERERSHIRRLVRQPEGCLSDRDSIYRSAERAGIELLRNWLDRLLAVPRKATFARCGAL